MDAYFIDATNRTVEVVKIQQPGRLQEYYKLIGCDLVEAGARLPNEDCIYIDEEGLLVDNEFGFLVNGQPLMGNGVWIGTTEGGRDRAPRTTLEAARAAIQFTDAGHIIGAVQANQRAFEQDLESQGFVKKDGVYTSPDSGVAHIIVNPF